MWSTVSTLVSTDSLLCVASSVRTPRGVSPSLQTRESGAFLLKTRCCVPSFGANHLDRTSTQQQVPELDAFLYISTYEGGVHVLWVW